MDNKVDASPEKGNRITRETALNLAKGEYNMELLKGEVAQMEKADRTQLLIDLRTEKLKLNTSEDMSISRRLVDLESYLEQTEKSLGTRTQEKIGAGIKTGIDLASAGAKKTTEFVGNQVKQGTDAVVQIGAQLADVVADPHTSQKEKMIHVAGIAAMVAVPAVLLYKLCKKMAGDGGDKSSLGRKLLKWTGFAFLGSLGVRALAPMVVEQQKKLMASKTTESAVEKPKADPAGAPPAKDKAVKDKEKPTPITFEVGKYKVGIVEGKQGKLLSVDGKTFHLRYNNIDLAKKSFGITKSSDGGVRIDFDALALLYAPASAILTATESKTLFDGLTSAENPVTHKVPAQWRGTHIDLDLEFIPETAS